MKAGACRYDTEGYVTEHITQEERQYAQARLEKVRRQNRIVMLAVGDPAE